MQLDASTVLRAAFERHLDERDSTSVLQLQFANTNSDMQLLMTRLNGGSAPKYNSGLLVPQWTRDPLSVRPSYKLQIFSQLSAF